MKRKLSTGGVIIATKENLGGKRCAASSKFQRRIRPRGEEPGDEGAMQEGGVLGWGSQLKKSGNGSSGREEN